MTNDQNAPGYIAPCLPECEMTHDGIAHHDNCKPAPTPAPAEAPKAHQERRIEQRRKRQERRGDNRNGGDRRVAKAKHAPPTAPASVTPASDEEVASVEPNIAKTAWETCSNCDAGLRSINVPPYLEGTHEDYCILTMWPKVIARIEHEQAANAELRAEGQKLKTAIDDLKRTVTEASMRRHEEIAALRARLAEVSEAAAPKAGTKPSWCKYPACECDVTGGVCPAPAPKGESKP